MREGIRPDGSKYIRKGPAVDQVRYSTIQCFYSPADYKAIRYRTSHRLVVGWLDVTVTICGVR